LDRLNNAEIAGALLVLAIAATTDNRWGARAPFEIIDGPLSLDAFLSRGKLILEPVESLRLLVAKIAMIAGGGVEKSAHRIFDVGALL
jgi:hypothetical protein